MGELIVKFFHGEFTKQGFKRYSGMWKGPPPGTVGKKDIAVGTKGLVEQMKSPMFVSKGGIGYGVDETQKVRAVRQACPPGGQAEQRGRDVLEGQLGPGDCQH